MSKKIMTKEAASRIQSATAKKNGGKVPPKSFAARAMRAAEKNLKNNLKKSYLKGNSFTIKPQSQII